MNLQSLQVKKLVKLIKDSFRVRKNVRPIYIDVGDNLDRLGAPQHQVIFGRRGSGKSCLLVEYLSAAPKDAITPIYILADEFKRLAYPDILIRLLVEILESMEQCRPWYRKVFSRHSATKAAVKELRALLDIAVEADVSEGHKLRNSENVDMALQPGKGVKLGLGEATEEVSSKMARFRERKIDTLERHLRDYKNAIVNVTKQWRAAHGCVLIDDFYLIPQERQPDVIDYLHRLLRDTDVYLKVATIRYRTTLLKNHPQTIGVELGQDVEEINLDRTLEDLETTQDFLYKMLSSMAEKVAVPEVRVLFNSDALQALTLASGGVPRDFLTIFVNAVEQAVAEGKPRWITPKHVNKGAGRQSYHTKLSHLKQDADSDAAGLERVLVDLMRFCLDEKGKTGFLVSQDESQRYAREHGFIQQLMDFKLIHVVEPDTSAASSRPGRYEAYTLDFALFMEPRRRGIEIVDFWKRGKDGHRVGVRESPVYHLERAGQIFDNTAANANAKTFFERADNEAATAEVPEENTKGEGSLQQILFDKHRNEK